MSRLRIHAVSPCCMPMLHTHSCPCCMSVDFDACPCSLRSSRILRVDIFPCHIFQYNIGCEFMILNLGVGVI
jgi:hypothetical protein